MLNFFDLLISFLLVHIICDFYLQPKKWVEAKIQNKHRAPQLYLHALLHGALLFIPAMVLNLTWQSSLYLVLIVAISHFFIDLWKVSSSKRDSFSYFVIDQVLHVSVLVIIAFYMADGLTIKTMLKHEHFADAVMIIFAYLLVLKPTSVVIGSILKKYLTPETNGNASGLVAGGELIGYLERVLILTFTLVGSYAAVGFVLAAKSIFRFGELNKSDDRSMTEYVLIGSLVSVVITTLLGTIISLGLDVKIK